MAMMIVAECIACDVCVGECPNEAILAGDPVYMIDGERCTECVGHHEAPACASVCPLDAVVEDPARRETRERLLAKLAA